MPDMSMQCETKGCGNKVSKPGYKLCLKCWKKNQSVAAGKRDSGGKNAEKSEINSSAIGEHFGIKAARVNSILNELGWVARDVKGWTASATGRAMKARQKTHYQSGVPYVAWPPEILQNKILRGAIAEHLGENTAAENPTPQTAGKTHDADEFRKKFPANFRATDGHMVRSKAEMLVDNFLYTSSIVHAYERKLPIEEDMYCDFYLPGGKVYIEYWGLENDAKYAARKAQKLAIYKKYNFNLIELSDKEVENLDDHLPRLLLKFGISVD